MLVLLALSVVVIYVGLKLKMPAIVGFLVTGVVVGPSGLGFVSDIHQIDSLAELGVVLLLFTIGLEFSVASLMKIKRTVFLGGGLQVLICSALTFILMEFLGRSWPTALLFGFLFSLSSTAIVLKLFQEKGEMDSAHGQSSLAVLIFQDLAVVPMVLVLPLMAGQQNSEPFYFILIKAALLLVFILLMAHTLVPRLLKRMAGTKSRELFMFTVVLICLGTAFLTAKAGLSLALGAFVAGLVISGSPYAHQAISSVLPMRDIFTSLFFVSIGMMMDLSFVTEHIFLTLSAALIVMGLNIFGTSIAVRIVGKNWRISLMVGFALCQIGEFSFVLAKEGNELGLLSADDMALFLNSAVLTMAFTPLALLAGRSLSPKIKLKKKTFEDPEGQPKHNLSGHAIIIGYGVVGQGVTQACGVAGIPYQIIEMNPHTVQNYQAKGEAIIYGDAVNEAVLEHVGVGVAKVLVITIPDPVATRRIVSAAKSLNPDLYIIARTRFLMEMATLHKLGANEVVPEEYETAVAVFSRVMLRFLVPLDEIERQVSQARAAGYVMLRKEEQSLLEEVEKGDYQGLLQNFDLINLTVSPASYPVGKTLAQLNLRQEYGLNVLLVKRDKEVISNPSAEQSLAPGDQVICLIADPMKVSIVHSLFHLAHFS